MNSFVLAAAAAASTWTALLALRPMLLRAGIAGQDRNKATRPIVPEEGGLAVAAAVSLALMWQAQQNPSALWVAGLVFVGCGLSLVDRLYGMSPRLKLVGLFGLGLGWLLIGSAAHEDIGPLQVIVLAASFSILLNAWNVLAGFNGLESGLAIISLASYTPFLHFRGHNDAAQVLGLAAISYLVLWWFNRCPARFFVGESGTFIAPVLILVFALETGEWSAVPFLFGAQIINAAIRFASVGLSPGNSHLPLTIETDGRLRAPKGTHLSLIRLYLRAKGPASETHIARAVVALQAVCSAGLLFLP